MKKEVSQSVVMFGRMTCQPSGNQVYLGETKHSQGLEDGIEVTINSRMGKIRGTMQKAKALMENLNNPAAQTAGADPSRCNSTPR